MSASTSLQIEDLVRANVPDEEANLPHLADQGRWRLRLAREGHPHGRLEPLTGLFDHFDAASVWPEFPSYRPFDEPLKALRAALSGEDSVYQAEAAVKPQAVPKVEESENLEPSPLAGLLGLEMLEIARSSALPPERRVEALEKVAIALVNPTRENVRAILITLLRD